LPPTLVDSIARMRIALVSPYSWTFPGGVTRHIDALAREFVAEGHHVRVLSPVDPDDRLTRLLHRRGPDPAPLPDYVVPLGRTASLPMNGAMSRLAMTPSSAVRLRSELRAGNFDVIHVHEPIAPVIGWDACTFDAGAPVVGTFHAYSSSWTPNTIARAIGARTVLELGALGGYSTIWLAGAVPDDGRVVSLEANAQHAEVARANVAQAGLASVVDVRVGPALETLPKLASDSAGPFDLVFLDADKRNNPEYLEWSLALSRPGTLIVADNVVRGGEVVDGETPDPDVAGIRRFTELLAANPRVTATAIQTVGSKGYDGFALALVEEA